MWPLQRTCSVSRASIGSRALLIDDSLEDLPGVHVTQTTVKSARVTVELDLTQSSSWAVIHAIEEFGYRASLLP